MRHSALLSLPLVGELHHTEAVAVGVLDVGAANPGDIIPDPVKSRLVARIAPVDQDKQVPAPVVAVIDCVASDRVHAASQVLEAAGRLVKTEAVVRLGLAASIRSALRWAFPALEIPVLLIFVELECSPGAKPRNAA